jgi:hypothetical protein
VLDKLRTDGDPVLQSVVFKDIERSIINKPEPYMAALGLRLPTPDWAGQAAAELYGESYEREGTL